MASMVSFTRLNKSLISKDICNYQTAWTPIISLFIYYYIIVHKVESLNYGNYVANVRNGRCVGYGCDDGHAPMISTESVIDQSSRMSLPRIEIRRSMFCTSV
jgi:hypothetical protein